MIIILGTGRCGSTLLSRMLAESQQAMILSEFFMALMPGAFPQGNPDGLGFWNILSRSRPKYSAIIGHGIRVPEYLYTTIENRERSLANVPPILLVTLPFLFGNPDEIYEHLSFEVKRWPSATLVNQYRRLFAELLKLADRSVVIERSGNANRFAADLAAHFPEAKFIRLHRQREACVASMSRHPTFRFGALIGEIIRRTGEDPYHSDRQDWRDLDSILQAACPKSFDSEVILRATLPREWIEALYDDSVEQERELFGSNQEPCSTVIDYEYLVTEPSAALRNLATFCGLSQEGPWINRASRQPDATKAFLQKGISA